MHSNQRSTLDAQFPSYSFMMGFWGCWWTFICLTHLRWKLRLRSSGGNFALRLWLWVWIGLYLLPECSSLRGGRVLSDGSGPALTSGLKDVAEGWWVRTQLLWPALRTLCSVFCSLLRCPVYRTMMQYIQTLSKSIYGILLLILLLCIHLL